jgi:hypothetical protein
VVYFHGRSAHTWSSWSIFKGDLPTIVHHGLFSGATGPHPPTGLFSGATCLHFILVYFHGRPAHTCSSWSIFKGDQPTHSHWSIFRGDRPTHSHGLFSWASWPHTHIGLFSRATYPQMFILVYFQGQPSHTLTLVYFHERPAHIYSLWSIFKGDLPFWLGLPKIPSDNLELKSISPPSLMFHHHKVHLFANQSLLCSFHVLACSCASHPLHCKCSAYPRLSSMITGFTVYQAWSIGFLVSSSS